MKRFSLFLSILLSYQVLCYAEQINRHEYQGLNHVRGCQSVGVRYGHGTKNRYDIGLTYAYCFNNKISLLVEIDRERLWTDNEFETCTSFLNAVMLSPGIEYNLIHPVKWFYWHWGIGPCVGYDIWHNNFLVYDDKCICVGAQTGTGVEFIPVTWLSFVLKGQQYVLFSKEQNYLKPNFSVAARFNFHR